MINTKEEWNEVTSGSYLLIFLFQLRFDLKSIILLICDYVEQELVNLSSDMFLHNIESIRIKCQTKTTDEELKGIFSGAYLYFFVGSFILAEFASKTSVNNVYSLRGINADSFEFIKNNDIGFSAASNAYIKYHQMAANFIRSHISWEMIENHIKNEVK